MALIRAKMESISGAVVATQSRNSAVAVDAHVEETDLIMTPTFGLDIQDGRLGHRLV
ncbi:hypothetical protein MY11210_001206 [Beauveria gryllotalpidicola]